MFRRHTIYRGGPAERMSCIVGDLDGDGVSEFIVSTRNPEQLHWFGRAAGGAWQPHLIDDTFPSISVGGALVDLTGNGRLDLIGATSDRGKSVYWWECPADPTRRWVRREAFPLPAPRTHDLLLADIDGDGRQELYVWNQDAETLFGVPLPDDPYATPWPEVRPVVTGVDEQALAAADVDGDGRLELIAGCSWYRLLPNGEWERHVYTREYGGVRVVAADFDGDGRPEIAVAEVALDIGRTYGRLALFRPGADVRGPVGRRGAARPAAWTRTPCRWPTSTVTDARICTWARWGAETGPCRTRRPRLLYLSRGDRMEQVVIDSGIGTHEAQAIELDGRFGIVSKPYRALADSATRPPEVDALYLYLPE